MDLIVNQIHYALDCLPSRTMTVSIDKMVPKLDRSIRHSQELFMRARHFYVYILASSTGVTLYIGVTNDLIRRVSEHRSKAVKGFTSKYDVLRLVYFEQFDDPENAIKREKRLKKWNWAWKIRLIEEQNPNWVDLYLGITGA